LNIGKHIEEERIDWQPADTMGRDTAGVQRSGDQSINQG